MKTKNRIQKQIEAATSLVKQTNDANTSNETPLSKDEALNESNTQVTQSEQPKDIQTTEVSQPESAESAPSQTFDPNAEINWQQRTEQAEQRYKVLQGKYNKEIVEARSQPKADNDEIMQLKQEIASLKSIISQKPDTPEPLQTQTAPEQDAQSSERLQNLRDDYGNELVDGLLAEFGQVAQQTAQQTAKQFEQTVDTFKQDSFATKKSMVAQLLAGQRINFDQVNNDPLFHDWLSKFDPNNGVQRQQKLSNLFESGDLHAVSNMFIEFMNGFQSNTNSIDFSDHVQQPTHAPQSPMDTTNTRQIYTPSMIQDFYANKRKGRYSPEEAQRIEREIFSSMKQ